MGLIDSETWKVYKLHLIMLLKLSWPNVLTAVVQLVLPVSSTYAVGHIQIDTPGGSTPLIGASALGNMFANATGNAVGSGLSMALDTLCSQAFGAKKYKLVGLHCQRAMVILTLVCIPIAILWSNAWFILQFIGTKEIAEFSQYWLKCLLPSLWPRVMYEAYKRYMLSQRVMWPLTLSVAVTVPFHVINTYLFVYKFDWGFGGAAYATSISYWILFLTLVVVSYIRLVVLRHRTGVNGQHVRLQTKSEMENETENETDNETKNENDMEMEMEMDLSSSVDSNVGLINERKEREEREGKEAEKLEEDELEGADGDPLHTWPAWSKDVFRGWIAFLRLGIATTLSLVIEWGSFEVNAVIASRLGSSALAAHAIMCNCTLAWYSFPIGVASATTALVGNMLGAGEPDRARIIAKIGFFVALTYGVTMGGLGLTYRSVLGRIFTDDDEVVELVKNMMFVMWFYVVVDALKAVGMAILRGSGRPKITVYGNVLSCIIVGYPVAILLVKFDYRLNGLWFGIATAWASAATIYIFIIKRTNWELEVINAEKRNKEAESSMKSGGEEREKREKRNLMSVVVMGVEKEGEEREEREEDIGFLSAKVQE